MNSISLTDSFVKIRLVWDAVFVRFLVFLFLMVFSYFPYCLHIFRKVWIIWTSKYFVEYYIKIFWFGRNCDIIVWKGFSGLFQFHCIFVMCKLIWLSISVSVITSIIMYYRGSVSHHGRLLVYLRWCEQSHLRYVRLLNTSSSNEQNHVSRNEKQTSSIHNVFIILARKIESKSKEAGGNGNASLEKVFFSSIHKLFFP